MPELSRSTSFCMSRALNTLCWQLEPLQPSLNHSSCSRPSAFPTQHNQDQRAGVAFDHQDLLFAYSLLCIDHLLLPRAAFPYYSFLFRSGKANILQQTLSESNRSRDSTPEGIPPLHGKLSQTPHRCRGPGRNRVELMIVTLAAAEVAEKRLARDINNIVKINLTPDHHQPLHCPTDLAEGNRWQQEALLPLCASIYFSLTDCCIGYWPSSPAAICRF